MGITVDSRVAAEAKTKLIGQISEICERALKAKLDPKKSDMPEEIIKLRCMSCNRVVDYGFWCDRSRTFFCKDCELGVNEVNDHRIAFNRCSGQECEHIRVPFFKGERDVEEEKKIIEKISNA